MAILNHTTKVSADRTASQIQARLVKARAQAVMMEYDPDACLTHLSFRVPTQHGVIPYRLPANVEDYSWWSRFRFFAWHGPAYASASHFFRKLAFAAPASGLPFLSIALGFRRHPSHTSSCSCSTPHRRAACRPCRLHYSCRFLAPLRGSKQTSRGAPLGKLVSYSSSISRSRDS